MTVSTVPSVLHSGNKHGSPSRGPGSVVPCRKNGGQGLIFIIIWKPPGNQSNDSLTSCFSYSVHGRVSALDTKLQ
ncbi:hypothetical protein SERLA73DRAFT_191960 [Serpula lacrymans var. lacrymans S7.3]|uniref:Uncharacterized protein n=2 Tax=Serpula lacrymans var. lacrymans TaxID=341189 RepID=F8QIP4_SERL3|nr:uncharacterized protein SERLADRAFT_473733 [Serpula lacrymans var. lacrymans S7.9]EGN91816.1 hypothetical protein SERLA73DRAFT_191960 [Serpula lacrymans var. lacrymans S7.3]EGO22630.1 hypothetical protein SERLADRAFT_473733 [Serpula lacrymans var. lacrymans S7.9]